MGPTKALEVNAAWDTGENREGTNTFMENLTNSERSMWLNEQCCTVSTLSSFSFLFTQVAHTSGVKDHLCAISEPLL